MLLMFGKAIVFDLKELVLSQRVRLLLIIMFELSFEILYLNCQVINNAVVFIRLAAMYSVWLRRPVPVRMHQRQVSVGRVGRLREEWRID